MPLRRWSVGGAKVVPGETWVACVWRMWLEGRRMICQSASGGKVLIAAIGGVA